MNTTYYFIFALAAVVFASGCVQYRQASFSDIVDNPQSFDKTTVTLNGVVIKNEGMFFGPEYQLASGSSLDSMKKIALSLKRSNGINFSNYVSYTFDGSTYTETTFSPVIVKGTIVYIGEATDSPSFYLEVESIEKIGSK